MKQPLYWKDERLRHAAVLFTETPLDRKRVIRCLLDSLYAVAQQKMYSPPHNENGRKDYDTG